MYACTLESVVSGLTPLTTGKPVLNCQLQKSTSVETLENSIIGEYWERAFVEALVSGNGSSLRVCIRVPVRAECAAYLRRADALLPTLIADMAAVEQIATQSDQQCSAKRGRLLNVAAPALTER